MNFILYEVIPQELFFFSFYLCFSFGQNCQIRLHLEDDIAILMLGVCALLLDMPVTIRCAIKCAALYTKKRCAAFYVHWPYGWYLCISPSCLHLVSRHTHDDYGWNF